MMQKNKSLKRMLAVVLAIVLVFTLLPLNAMQASAGNPPATLKSVVYNNTTPPTVSVTFTCEGTINSLDTAIGTASGLTDIEYNTADTNNPSNLVQNSDGSYTVTMPVLLTTMPYGSEKPAEGDEVYVGIEIITSETGGNPFLVQIPVTIPAEGRTVTVQPPSEGADQAHTLTINYLVPVGPTVGNVQVASHVSTVNGGASYSVTSPSYPDLYPDQATVSGTMPNSDLTINVKYSELYTATVEYKLASGVSRPSNFRTINRTTDLKDGDEYTFTPPVYEGLAADRKEVKGHIAGKNATEIVTYREDDFTVTIYHRADASMSSAGSTLLHEQQTGYTHHGYKDGEFYSVESPSYYGVRPLRDKVEGTIDSKDVEETVYYTDTCTNAQGHNFVVSHDGQTHKEKCEYCGIEKTPQTAQVTYEPTEAVGGERANTHSVHCGVCGDELSVEPCSATSQPGQYSGCSGECANCHATFNYGDEHDYTGAKWTYAGSSHHKRTCNRCGYEDTDYCNTNGWAHRGSGASAQHSTACGICKEPTGNWTNCTYRAERLGGGRHTHRCECGRTNGTEDCHFELQSTTATTHTYKCFGCNTTITANHTRKTKKENPTSATKYTTASYQRVTYCGRCQREISRETIGGRSKSLPVTKVRKQKVKDHFTNHGGGAVRRGGGRVQQPATIVADPEPVVVSEAIEDYLFDNYDTFLQPAEDALDAYFTAHPEHSGEGWRIDLQPNIVVDITEYDAEAGTITVDISATYDVYVTNDNGIDVLIAQNYELPINSEIDLEFSVPAALGDNGDTLYVRHTHGRTYYYYEATVTEAAAEDPDFGPMATVAFTSTAGLSTFELSTTEYSGSGSGGGGGYVPSGGGGGSITPSTPKTEEITVPVTDNTSENSTGGAPTAAVEVKATVTEGMASVNDITADDIDKVVEGLEKAEEPGGGDAPGEGDAPAADSEEPAKILIDLSGAKQDVNAVEIKTSTMENIADASEKSDKLDGVAIKLADAEIELDGTAAGAIADQAKGGEIKLTLEETKTENLNEKQQEALKDCEVESGITATFESNGEEIHRFNGGQATISKKFDVPAGKDPRYFHLYFLGADGTLTRQITRLVNGFIQGIVNHCSDYVIIYDTSFENETETGDNWKQAEILPDTCKRNENGTLQFTESGLGSSEISDEVVRGGAVYRMYNPNSGEHMYTKNTTEMEFLVSIGWSHEADADFSVNSFEAADAKPVYRVYNPNTGLHHYTMDIEETKALVGLGWGFEGVVMYAIPSDKTGGVPLYRLYNPNDSQHLWTVNKDEYDIRGSEGWSKEEIAWLVK